MKKIIIRLICLIILIVTIIISIFVMTGYNMYKEALTKQDITSKVNEIQSSESYTKLEEISPMYKDAVIAVEDHRFYEHKGIDAIALARAMGRNIIKRELLEGGSSITQQLAKNTYFTQNKEITRKIAEAFMAIKYEKILDKDLILELYVNTSYFGDGYYDVGTASRGYFNKNPDELNNYEATMLAGIPNAPSVYSPTVNFKLASQRQKQVLEKMVKYKYITKEESEEILSQTEKYREYFENK